MFLFIDGPALVCGWVNFPILWPHTPVKTKLKCPPRGLGVALNVNIFGSLETLTYQMSYTETSIKRTPLGPRKYIPFREVSAENLRKSYRKRNVLFSSFKRRGVYLILGLLGAAFIRGRRLFQKSE